ncbi:MAG: NAD(P)-dependent alcohol dehydrogenase [Chloroflexota bacterium]
MKAVVISKYGTPDDLKLRDIDKPTPQEGQVLIKTKAVSINASDIETLRGNPAYVRLFGGFFKPNTKILGSDIAGVVESVGPKVTQFKPGDELFGDIFWKGSGGLAEYVLAPVENLIHKPINMSFAQAAALPQAGVLALQAFRDYKKLEPSHKVLINGAGGGMGTFALQMAKRHGVEVTGVDSNDKFDLMNALGADRVLDFRKTNYTKMGHKYDFIVDAIAHRSYFSYRRALKPDGEFLMVGGGSNSLIQVGLMGPQLSRVGSKKIGLLRWRPNTEDLHVLCDLFKQNQVVPIIDRCFSFSETSRAFSYFGKSLAKGKIVITMR